MFMLAFYFLCAVLQAPSSEDFIGMKRKDGADSLFDDEVRCRLVKASQCQNHTVVFCFFFVTSQ